MIPSSSLFVYTGFNSAGVLSFTNSSTPSRMQSFMVSESVNGLFLLTKIHETRKDTATDLSYVVHARIIVAQLCFCTAVKL